jgi:uncharacterized tellurite resistance protein B-like protein
VLALDEELRHTLCRLIAGLVVSDDDLAPEEDAFIDRMLARFGIKEREAIFPIVDRAEAAAKVRELPAKVQQEAFTWLVEAAIADGKVVDEERSYLRAVGEVIGLSTDETEKRIEAALVWRSE